MLILAKQCLTHELSTRLQQVKIIFLSLLGKTRTSKAYSYRGLTLLLRLVPRPFLFNMGNAKGFGSAFRELVPVNRSYGKASTLYFLIFRGTVDPW